MTQWWTWERRHKLLQCWDTHRPHLHKHRCVCLPFLLIGTTHASLLLAWEEQGTCWSDVILTQITWNNHELYFCLFFFLTLSVLFKPQRSRSILNKVSVTQCLLALSNITATFSQQTTLCFFGIILYFFPVFTGIRSPKTEEVPFLTKSDSKWQPLFQGRVHNFTMFNSIVHVLLLCWVCYLK